MTRGLIRVRGDSHSDTNGTDMDIRPIHLAAFALFVAVSIAAAPAFADAPSVARATLANGLRVIAVRDTLAPVVTTEMNYLVGSEDDPPDVPGMAHAQEHMLFRGSTGVSGAQLASIAAGLGGDLNGDTQPTVTQYVFTVPANALEVVLRVEADRMRGALLSQDDWVKERGAIEQEVSSDLSNPIYQARADLLADMFVGTPYAAPGVGTRDAFDSLSATTIKSFYDLWYRPNNAVLVVVGDVDPSAVIADATRLFGAIPSAPLPAHPSFALPSPKLADVTFDTALPLGFALVAYRFPGSDSHDFAAAEILANVMADERSPFFSGLPHDKVYNATFVLDDMPKASLGLAMASALKPQFVPDVKRWVSMNVADSISAGFSADLVLDAKRKAVAQALFQRSSIEGLAQAWSEAVAVEGRSSPDDDIAEINAVSTDDVNRVAGKYLNASTELTAELTPRDSGTVVPGDAFGASESFSPQAAESVALPDWAASVVQSTDVPPSTLHPLDTSLPNGLRIIIQSERGSGAVTVVGHVRNDPDIEAPPGKEGVSLMLDQLFSAGSASESPFDFFTDVSRIGAEEHAGFAFSLRVPAAGFDRGMQLLADNEMRPLFPPQNFELLRNAVADRVQGTSVTPEYRSAASLYAALYPKNDPVQRVATVASVEGLSLQDVRDYFKATIRPDLTTIVVVGDVDTDHALAIVRRYFSDWHSSGAPPATTLPPAPRNAGAEVAIPSLGAVQDSVTFAETMGVRAGTIDFDALSLGDQMLSSEFYASRLYRDLREQSGLVYYVTTRFNADGGRYAYEVQWGCDPRNVAQVAGIVQRDLQSMRTTPPTVDELLRAKSLAVRALPLQESSQSGVAETLLDRASAGLPLDDASAQARFLQITGPQITAAFAKYIRPGDFVQIVQGPTP